MPKIWLLILLFLAPGLLHAQNCSPDVRQRSAGALALQSKLLAVSVGDLVQDIPQPLRPVLHDFKQALIDMVETGLRCNNPVPERIQPDLAGLLHANRPQKPSPPSHGDEFPQTGVYGAGLTLAVRPVSGVSETYSVQIGFGIPCGNDNIVLVYERTPQGYRRELLWQNPDLNTISDAFGDVYFFSPVQAPVPSFLVLHGTPWCTSNLSEFKADLIALATPSAPQRLLDHMEDGYRRDGDAKFLTEPDGFEFKSSVESGDTDIIIRPSVMRFQTSSGRFVRLPVETSARAFVDSWLSADWKMVAGWGDPGSEARLKKMHDDMTGVGADFVNFGPTLACAGHYQVELDMQADHTTAQLQIIDLPNKYAEVRTNANSFTLLGISDKADPTCHGPDLMAPVKARRR